ncbi:hypothetical protein [Lyngbya sp. PCC 8106]|uniref:hypothetical protein n=1 Tax=Lyngbya sp. (strain PCC 8106) TaxID=313612 RepID=UPI0000EACBC2|nr:hypothetical protein [Lyngbya sp. PCC 8106]EAW33367.1 hypothetical protein L8106_22706 [Lyngbya sp. PCC 8106]
MNSQQLAGQILAKVKQINLQLSELQNCLATQEKLQTKLHIASLKGRRRGLLEVLQLLNESWKDTDSLLNPYQNLGETSEKQLQNNQPAMNWCKERLNALNSKWKIK